MMNRAYMVLMTGSCLLLGNALLAAHTEDAIAQRARKLHVSSIVLDTHIDVTPKLQRPNWDFTEEHTEGHIDLPRMRKGGLDGLFFSIYMAGTVTGPRAVNDAIERIAAVHRLAEDVSDQVALCTTAAQVHQAHRRGKIAALMGMEGGHMINNSLAVLRMYAELGVRYLTLTHSVNTEWADSSGDQPKHNGLTEFGKEVVRELNRLGVMVDISHVSDKTFWDALDVSRAPMIASHSSCRAIAGHPRNMTDDMIKALAAKGGVIHINYADAFLDNDLAQYSLKRAARMRELAEKYPGDENVEQRRKMIADEFGPRPKARWEKIVEHLDHAVKLAGADHVGLGSDFDGASMPEGMEDVAQLPKVTEALLRKGYRGADIKKILGKNTLRVMAEVERVAAQMQAHHWRAARQKRGIEDYQNVQVDLWSAGWYGFPDEANIRVARGLPFYRGTSINVYAHPIEGLVAYLDLTHKRILKIVDTGVVPVPRANAELDSDSNAPLRAAPKPLHIVQPEGASFELRGHEVRWQNYGLPIFSAVPAPTLEA
jgi:membrane dipeptidase